MPNYDSNLQPTEWASNSEEVKDNLDHSATGIYLYSKGKQSTVQANIKESLEKFWRALKLQPLQLLSAVLSTELLRLIVT